MIKSWPVCLFLALICTLQSLSHGQLQVGFYSNSCPNAESTVTSVVSDSASSDPTILPALLRMQFHDCFVRGCDASVLIKNANNNAEINNKKHQGLRATEIIDSIKAQLEAQCPGVVSCADVIALAARDAITMTGGPAFDVPTGRRDGRVSNLRDADVLPDVHDSFDQLKSNFAANGLSEKDVVILSAAHTIGTTACFFVTDRLYNFPLPGGGTGADPSINPDFLPELMARCPQGNANTRLALDRGSEMTFDTQILSNIRSGYAVIASDAALYSDSSARETVDSYFGLLNDLFGQNFMTDFADAMVRMGSVGVITGSAGEVRRVCTAFN